MATSYQQLDFSSRLANSARSLTSATFSGSGIEAELRRFDPLGFGKRVAAQSSRSAVLPTDFSKSVSNGLIRGGLVNGFRSGSAWSAEVEHEYMEFASGPGPAFLEAVHIPDDFIGPLEERQIRSAWHSLWNQKQTDSGISTPSSELEDTEPVWERSSQGEVVFQEGKPQWQWRHVWRRISKAHSKEDLALQGGDQAPFELLLAKQMDGLNLHRSSALVRLDQIRQHLTRSERQPRELDSWREDWLMHQGQRCDWTVEKEDDHVQAPQDQLTEEEPEKYYFRCPWRECHHHLLRQHESLSLDIRHRVCVHEGCGYVSDTVDAWLRHITSPHHDLRAEKQTPKEMTQCEDHSAR